MKLLSNNVLATIAKGPRFFSQINLKSDKVFMYD